MVLLGLCVLAFAGGVFHFQLAEDKAERSYLIKENDLSEEIILRGIVIRESEMREQSRQITVGKIRVREESVVGHVLITTEKYSSWNYGDEIEFKGKLVSPPVFPEFNYRNYLLKDSIYSLMYHPEITLIGKDKGNFILAKILGAKKRIEELIFRSFSPPHSSFLTALLIGDQSKIGQDWNLKLSYAGLRHLTAVSGMHVAILTALFMSVLLGLGLRQRQSFLATLVLMVLFVILTGLHASAIRAGIMGGFYILGRALGRESRSSRSIVFAALLMLIQNPFLLKNDIGFQLSFLAMLGIIYLMPHFKKFLNFLPNSFQLKESLTMTLSAQVFTIPVLIYNFGYISLVSPISNVLVVPVLSWIMGLGFLFILAGTIWFPLGWIFSLPLWFLLSYLIKIVELASSLSFSLMHI